VNLGPAEILVILVVALLVFGPTRLPEIGRQVGKGVREFRKFQRSLSSDLNDVLADDVSDHAEPAPTLPPRDTPAVVKDVDIKEDGDVADAPPAEPVDAKSSDREPETPPAPPAGTAT
jgi:sec-independent protein translocase protein TatA